MADPVARIDTLRDDRIPGNDDISAADEEALLNFSDELFLRKSEYTDYRHEKLLRHCTRMAERVGGLSDALEERDAAENDRRRGD